MNMNDSFGARSKLTVGGRGYEIFRLSALAWNGIDIARLPYSLRILLEDLLRTEDGVTVTREDIEALAGWSPANAPLREIAFTPARVLLQDFTGVPGWWIWRRCAMPWQSWVVIQPGSIRCSRSSWWWITRYR